MKYFAGIDGGGTSTLAEIRFTESEQVIRLRNGSLNFNGGSSKEIRENLESLLEEIVQKAGPAENCQYLCLGAAGISNRAALDGIKNILENSPFQRKFQILNDCETAFYGALNGEAGAVLIAGTGSVCYGEKKNGEILRCGGCGYLLDDGGSGYWIGREILRSAAEYYDGRNADSTFIPYLRDVGITDKATLVSHVYMQENPKGAIAQFSRLLPKAYSSGSILAASITERAAKELCELAIPVAEKLDWDEKNLALFGGVFAHHPGIRQQVSETLTGRYPELCVFSPIADAAHGACLFAEKLFIKG